jgi:uncharacterized protein DUF3850
VKQSDLSILASQEDSQHTDAASFADAITHELKCWPEFFEAISEGHKTHDLRRTDDRTFRLHDLIKLREFDPKTERYSGREQMVEITYITSADVPCALSERALDPAYCILSIRKRT